VATHRVYVERVSSNRTEAFVVALTLASLLVLAWRMNSRGLDRWGVLLLAVAAYLLFCALNYRTLLIQVTERELSLSFGVVSWTIPLGNIAACSPDDTSLWRIGGSGLHFTLLGGRYRAMFNFLEHPRLVIALKARKGLVRDIAFSTTRPDELLRLIQAGIVQDGAAGSP